MPKKQNLLCEPYQNKKSSNTSDTYFETSFLRSNNIDMKLQNKNLFTALEIHKENQSIRFKNYSEIRQIYVPYNRFKSLKDHWIELKKPIVENMRLEIKINFKTRNIKIKKKVQTKDARALQRAFDFVDAFIKGFKIKDAIAILRIDDLYVYCFEIKDLKTLKGQHLNRAIGRLIGRSGKTKFMIENATRTRITIVGAKISILGSFNNIRTVRNALCSLIVGSPPHKLYSNLQSLQLNRENINYCLKKQ